MAGTPLGEGNAGTTVIATTVRDDHPLRVTRLTAARRERGDTAPLPRSTLVRMLNGLIPATTGSILIDGDDIASASAPDLRRIRREKIAMVFQHFSLFPHWTVAENVAYGLKVKGVDAATRDREAREVLDRVGLAAWADALPSDLSGGMQQRVGIARGLASGPEILLMDEPFGPLDAQTRQIMGNLLLELWTADRKAVLFVTHDLEEAIALADRVVIMSAGPSARIIGDWRITLPRPRDIAEIRMEKDFHALHREIWGVLKDEVMKGYAQSTQAGAA